MLYLAEVRKQKSGGILAKTSTDLKLLACQRNDQSWSAIPNDEVIEAEAASGFDSGVLVVVKLNGNRQIQGTPEAAATQVVRDLQRFSRLQEKIKEQEEEIEGWKQSLTMQAQSLKEREMELDAELDELEQLRNETPEGGGGAAIDSEELEQAKAEAQQAKDDFERKNQELEQAWAHLRGEQQRLEEQKQDLPAPSSGGGIDPEQAQRLQELADYLGTTHFPVDELNTQMQALRDRLESQYANLDHYNQQLEEQRADAQQQQAAVDAQQQDWEDQSQALQNTRVALDETRQQVQAAQTAWQLHQARVEALNQDIEATDTMFELLSALAAGDAIADDADKSALDVAALEAMPMDELQTVVDELQKEFDRNAKFIEDQEEELKLQREAVAEIEEKLKSASVYDASALEQELADEQEQRKLLDETLVGQRRTLLDKQTTLKAHLKVLRRRQGIPEEAEDGSIDLTPALQRLEAQKSEQETVLAQLTDEASDRETAVQTTEAELQTQLTELDRQQGELQTLEAELTEVRSSTALLWGRVNLYEELLEQLQAVTQETQQEIDGLAALIEQAQQTSDYQQEAIKGLGETIAGLAATA